jgi:hypothetical protein
MLVEMGWASTNIDIAPSDSTKNSDSPMLADPLGVSPSL